MRFESRLLAGLAAALIVTACGEEMMMTGEPPDAPAVDQIEALTNQSLITITGTGEAGALVQAEGGAGPAEATAGEDGAFTLEVMLNEDTENVLLVSQTVAMMESEAVSLTVTHDGTPPEAPTVNPVTTPTRRAMQTLRGAAEAGATVTITGGAEEASGTAAGDGTFEISVALETTESGTLDNDLMVVATDLAGNASAATEVTITHDPSIALEAPILDDYPAFTNMSTITLTGEAEAGVSISAAGGASDGEATVAEDGTFSVEVGLRPNQPNTILVYAVSESETSIGAVAMITHDDVAPFSPNVDPEASPTGAEIVTLTGTAEPGVSVDVTGGAADASTTADAEGAFVVDVMLTVDAENALSVTARDAAGNESEPVSLAITQDSTLDAPVLVNPVASPTQDSSVTLSGTATPDVEVVITGGAAEATTMSDPTGGSWSTIVELTPNARNELHVAVRDSEVETIVVIVHDDTPPEAPALNEIASPTAAITVPVSGTTEAGADVRVNGGASGEVSGAAGPDGRFSIDVMIAADTTTTLEVDAIDRAGNRGPTSSVTVEHSSSVPDAPVIEGAGINPPDTNMAMHTIVGHVTAPGAGIMIRVTGGSSDVTAATDETSGNFSIDVPLNANTENTLSVVSIMGTIESAPAVVTITHDDIAPVAPTAAQITATGTADGGLGACGEFLGPAPAGTINGNSTPGSPAIEPGALIHLENTTQGETHAGIATASDDGSFTANAHACPGDQLRIWAEDAAGNEGASVTLTAM